MTIRQQPTLEEFLQWPERKPYLELIHGVVHQRSMPNAAHSYLQSELTHQLRLWKSLEQGYALTEQRCILTSGGEPHVVLPDVAWWPREQLPVLPDGPVCVPPMVAIEIVSPDDAYSAVQEKVVVYLGADVPIVWVVDPRARKVASYRQYGPPVFIDSTGTLQDPLLEGLSISLATLFAPLPAPPQPAVE